MYNKTLYVRITVQLMQNGILNTKSQKEDCEWTLSSFENPLTNVRWGKCVPITDIDVILQRVYTTEEKKLIDSCETEHPEISHSPLNKILYGHPSFKGFFPACQSPIMHLKGHVESRVLGESPCLKGFTVNEGNLEQIRFIESHLKTNKMVHPREKDVVDQWVKPTIIEQRDPSRILSDLVLASKLHDSSADYKDWIAVSKCYFPWNLLLFL